MNLDKHRNLFNGDWGTFFWAPGLWQPEGGAYSTRAIERFIDLLAESGVDTFLISPNTQVAWYPSRAVPTALDGYVRGDPRWAEWMPGIAPETNLIMMDHYLDMLEAGVDWLAEAIRLCRQRGISPWVSVRMNDMHGAGDPEGNPINCPLFRDAKNRLRGTPMNPQDPPKPYWQALNYECPEVRDYMLDMIRELVLEYDFDGMELDWLRNPAICEPNASQATIDSMTSWVAQIRAVTEDRSRQTGRPYPVGVRIPGQLSMLRSIGLDVKTIAKAGFIDFASPSNFMETAWDMPYDQLRADLPGVTMYGVIEVVLNNLQGYSPELDTVYPRHVGVSLPTLRGNAAGKLVLGADGIEQYNYYATDEDNANLRLVTWDNMRADYGAIRDIHDLEALRGKPKHYAMGTMFSSCWYPPFELPEPLPAILEPEWRKAFRLPMCAEPADRGLGLVVQVVVEKRDNLPDIGVCFNGSWPNFERVETDKLLFPNRPATHHLPKCQAYNYAFAVQAIREGWNEIAVYNGEHPGDVAQDRLSSTITIVSVEVAVR